MTWVHEEGLVAQDLRDPRDCKDQRDNLEILETLDQLEDLEHLYILLLMHAPGCIDMHYIIKIVLNNACTLDQEYIEESI